MKKYQYKKSVIEFVDELPSHWKDKRLKDVTKFQSGYGFAINLQGRSHENAEIPFLKVSDINGASLFTKEASNYVTRSDLKENGWKLIRENSILLPKIGEALRKNHRVVNLEPCLIDNNLLAITPQQHKIVTPYLVYLLLNIDMDIFVKSGVLPSIKMRRLRNFKIPLPPLPEQKAIADYLDTACRKIDRVIAMKEKQIEKIEDFLQSKVNEFISGQNFTGNSVKFNGSELTGDIPKKWEEKRLKQVLSKINSGVTPDGGAESYVDEGIPLIRSQNVTFEGLKLDDVAHITKEIHDGMSNSKVENGDVLLNITGASMGRCFYVKNMGEVNVNQHVCILRPRYQILTKYLYYFLMSNIGQAQIFAGYTGSGREGLNFQAIKNFRIPLPDISIQEDIIEQLDIISAKVKKQKGIIKNQINIIKDYKKSLIHECITGKKQVAEKEEGKAPALAE